MNAKSELPRCNVCHKPLTKGEVGATCQAHEGKLRQTAQIMDKVPEGWVRMSVVCRHLEAAGFTTNAIVKAAGGDACTDPILDPLFQVVYVGRGKWMNPEVMAKGADILRKSQAVKAETKPVKKSLPAELAAEIAATLASSPNAGVSNGKKQVK